MGNRKQRRKYLIADYLMSALGWGLFFFYRRYFVDAHTSVGVGSPFFEFKFYVELLVMPVAWIFVFYISGYYEGLFNKSRITEFVQTLLAVLCGTFLLFFTLLLNDNVASYKHYYLTILVLFFSEFICVYALRAYLTFKYHRTLNSGLAGFRTLIIGDTAAGVKEAADIPAGLGNRFVGVVMKSKRVKGQIVNGFKCLGSYDELDEIIHAHRAEEVILGLENADVGEVQKILNVLYRRNVSIKVIPDVYEMLIGSARLTPIYGCNMMSISHEIMSPLSLRIKRLMDIAISSVVLLILSPVFLYVIVRIRLGSKGSPVFKQERIGKNGRPFMMYKFRSMVVNAETSQPLLTTPNDDRITKYGRFMRKYRIDELPQFWNVLKGDMAVVGPRPERQFFIDCMVASAPDYFFLQKIRPGITSLGMVKFGYADNVEKMLKRFKYDLIYVENMNLMLDLKILYYTFFVIVTGKGV